MGLGHYYISIMHCTVLPFVTCDPFSCCYVVWWHDGMGQLILITSYTSNHMIFLDVSVRELC